MQSRTWHFGQIRMFSAAFIFWLSTVFSGAQEELYSTYLAIPNQQRTAQTGMRVQTAKANSQPVPCTKCTWWEGKKKKLGLGPVRVANAAQSFWINFFSSLHISSSSWYDPRI